MKSIKKIAGYNLLGILLYSIIVRLVDPHDDSSILVFSAIFVALHVFTCVIVSLMHFSDRNKEYGRAWLLSAGIVLLVGFSVCLGNASI